MKNNDNHLRLFVYGTLKKGFWNHDRFCTRAISIDPATTWGRLYRLEAFDPNGRCVYTRVLVAVETNDLIRPVWLYNYKLGHNMERIASGRWYQA